MTTKIILATLIILAVGGFFFWLGGRGTTEGLVAGTENLRPVSGTENLQLVNPTWDKQPAPVVVKEEKSVEPVAPTRAETGLPPIKGKWTIPTTKGEILIVYRETKSASEKIKSWLDRDKKMVYAQLLPNQQSITGTIFFKAKGEVAILIGRDGSTSAQFENDKSYGFIGFGSYPDLSGMIEYWFEFK